jgi:hypothetical protein
MSDFSSRVLQAFASLAAPTSENVFTSNAKFGAMFKEGQVKAAENAKKVIVGELATVADRMSDRQLQLAQTAVALRRQADQAEEATASIRAAFVYGESTDNYLPLLSVLDLVSVSDYHTSGLTRAEWEELLTIPEGWSPVATAE